MRHFLAAALIALGTQAGAATYTYDEATDGDLSADFSTVFTLALGETLTVSGIRDGDDYDTFAVVYDPAYRLTGSVRGFNMDDSQPGYAQAFTSVTESRTFRVRLTPVERPSLVPLPASGVLLLAGLAGLALRARQTR